MGGGFDPLSLEPVLWLDRKRSGFTTESGDRITQWDDLSGNGYHATAASGSAARPTLGSDGVQFDGVGASLVASFSLAQPLTVVAVFHMPTVPASSVYLFDGAVGDSMAVFLLSGGAAYMLAGLTLPLSNIVGITTVGTFVFNGASSAGYLNGSLDVTGDVGARDPNGVTLGRYAGFGYNAAYTLKSFFIAPRVLTEVERSKVEQYLAKEYEVSL